MTMHPTAAQWLTKRPSFSDEEAFGEIITDRDEIFRRWNAFAHSPIAWFRKHRSLRVVQFMTDVNEVAILATESETLTFMAEPSKKRLGPAFSYRTTASAMELATGDPERFLYLRPLIPMPDLGTDYVSGLPLTPQKFRLRIVMTTDQ